MDLAVLQVRLDAIRQSIDLVQNYRNQLLAQIVVAGEPIVIPDTVKQKLQKQIEAELDTLFAKVELLKKEVYV